MKTSAACRGSGKFFVHVFILGDWGEILMLQNEDVYEEFYHFGATLGICKMTPWLRIPRVAQNGVCFEEHEGAGVSGPREVARNEDVYAEFTDFGTILGIPKLLQLPHACM